MTHYLRTGNSFQVSEDGKMDVYDRLPVGNYIISQDRHGNFFFDRTDSFEMPGKIYGNTIRNVDRILNTFGDRPSSTGVMLTGEKGSGKTLLAKMLSITGAQQGIPTILINRPWRGNPLMDGVDIEVFEKTGEKTDSDDDDEGTWSTLSVRPADCKKIDSQGHRFVFTSERGSIVLTRQPEKQMDYGMFV